MEKNKCEKRIEENGEKNYCVLSWNGVRRHRRNSCEFIFPFI